MSASLSADAMMIKKLQEENKKLKEQKQNFVKLSQKAAKHSDESHKKKGDYILKLQEEIKKLKEEQFDNMEELAKSDGMCLVDIKIFDKLIEEEEENKKLKEENKELRVKLKEKEEEFAAAVKGLNGTIANEQWSQRMASQHFNEEIKELKEENKELRVNWREESTERIQTSRENRELKEQINGDGWLKQGYKTDLSNSHKQQNSMVKQIVELKKELKQLKEECGAQSIIDKLNEEHSKALTENVELTKENKEYTDMFHEIRDYMKMGECYEVGAFDDITDNQFNYDDLDMSDLDMNDQ